MRLAVIPPWVHNDRRRSGYNLKPFRVRDRAAHERAQAKTKVNILAAASVREIDVELHRARQWPARRTARNGW
jgi:hypothetical protein